MFFKKKTQETQEIDPSLFDNYNDYYNYYNEKYLSTYDKFRKSKILYSYIDGLEKYGLVVSRKELSKHRRGVDLHVEDEIYDALPRAIEIKKIESTPADQIIQDFYKSAEMDITKAEEEIKNTKPIDFDLDKISKSGFQTNKIKSLKEKKEDSESLADSLEAAKYFRGKYSYPFITKESIIKLCKKYHLVFGDAYRFIGEIPDKNLRDIESFEIEEKDKALNPLTTLNIMRPKEMMIAAPHQEMNLTGAEVHEFEVIDIKQDDPIVFQPVKYEGVEYYLIVTAWGEESEDSLVKKGV